LFVWRELQKSTTILFDPRVMPVSMPVSSKKNSWFGLNTLTSALNCCLRFSFCWRASLCIWRKGNQFLKLSHFFIKRCIRHCS
jgi:hypothetical protein